MFNKTLHDYNRLLIKTYNDININNKNILNIKVINSYI